MWEECEGLWDEGTPCRQCLGDMVPAITITGLMQGRRRSAAAGRRPRLSFGKT